MTCLLPEVVLEDNHQLEVQAYPRASQADRADQEVQAGQAGLEGIQGLKADLGDSQRLQEVLEGSHLHQEVQGDNHRRTLHQRRV